MGVDLIDRFDEIFRRWVHGLTTADDDIDAKLFEHLIESFARTDGDDSEVGPRDGAHINGPDEDENGPFSLGIYVKKYLDKGSFRAAVISSDYFLDPEINRAVGGNNHNLFIKLLAAVSEAEEYNQYYNYSYT